MIKFGPAGNSDSFYAQGYKSTWQAPKWLKEMGLNAYEYSFGRGVNLSDEGAEKVRAEAEKYGISVSAHAPYFINLANPDREKIENSFRYITEGARAVKLLGGNRLVVHIGAQLKLEREQALKNCRENLGEALKRLDDLGLSDVHICAETMGKKSQIGDLYETLAFCLMDEKVIPCIDFAHLHALHGGALNGQVRRLLLIFFLSLHIGSRSNYLDVSILFPKTGKMPHLLIKSGADLRVHSIHAYTLIDYCFSTSLRIVDPRHLSS